LSPNSRSCPRDTLLRPAAKSIAVTNRSKALANNLHRASAVLLLLLLFAQLLFSAKVKSPTFDEPNHLSRGYGYSKTGDPRMSRDEGHPVLLNVLCALPLLLLGEMPPPEMFRSWHSGFRNAFAIELLFGGIVPVQRLFFLARLPVMLMMLCLASLSARWAGELYGPWGRTLTLVLCVFDPNLIAHGRLVTTDLGITMLFFLSTYLFWRFLRRPSLAALLLTSVAVGLAHSTKYSAVLLFPMLGMLGMIEAFSGNGALCQVWPQPVLGKRWLSGLTVLGTAMAVIVVLAGLTVWAVYGFSYGQPTGWQVSTPAPIYIEGLVRTFGHAASIGHPAFLMGDRSTQGWWYYFPVAFALKTPLPALLGLLGAVLSSLWQRFSRTEWPLLLVPVSYFALSMRSVLNIGYRHLLPMLPFLWVYIGRTGPLLVRALAVKRRRWIDVLGGALCVWLAVGTLSIAPHYLAYFNALGGGVDGGWEHLVDSNLDWGQDLPALKMFVDQGTYSRIYLSWFGCTYPHLYGLDLEYRLLPSHFGFPYPGDTAQSAYNPVHPAPGLYVIGATNLQGVGLAGGDVFASFREQEPLARLGHSLFLYKVPPSPLSANPTCISDLRFGDLSPELTALSLGRGPGAVKWFDHGRSFILPGTGDPVYVLPSLPLTFAPDWQDAFLDRARIVHEQMADVSRPSIVAYALDDEIAQTWATALLSSLSVEPIGWSAAVIFDGAAEIQPLATPVSFDYGLQLLGYRYISGSALQPGQSLEFVTVWRATAEIPAEASDLRIFAHLLDEHGQLQGGEDRLDLEPPTWEAGDLLIQYHRVPLSADARAGKYQVELGVYTVLPMRRLAVFDGDLPIADRVLLQAVAVGSP
jgi:hypothetical protein